MENTYWNDKGKYQKEVDILQKLIPDRFGSGFKKVELFRNITNLYYDYYNNGFCNYSNYKDQIQNLNRNGFHITKNITEENLENMVDLIVESMIGEKRRVKVESVN